MDGGSLAENLSMESVPAKNGFKVGISGLTTGFNSMGFKFKSSFITLKGAVEVQCREVSMNATFRVETQTLSDGRKIMAFGVAHFEMEMPSDKMSMIVHGNIETKVAVQFKNIFVSIVEDEVRKGLETSL